VTGASGCFSRINNERRVAIYKLNSDSFHPLLETSFQSENILERRDLQRLLRQQPEIVSPNTLIIAEEFGEWEDSRIRIDLLGLDKQARFVVIELKRDETGSHMELQAVRYASMVSTMTFEKAVEIYKTFLKQTGQQNDAQEELLGFLEWDEPKKSEFASDVRIVLAAAEFSKELTTSVLWLNDRDLDIRCVRLKPYKADNQILVDVQQVIPLPEAEEYQIRVREQTEQRREARRDERDLTKYKFQNETYNKRNLVLAVVKAILQKSPALDFNSLEKLFPDKLGVFSPIEEAEATFQRTNIRRHFLAPEDIITTSDHRRVVVSNQWSKSSIDVFREAANKMGFSISEISYS
jgi:hypothetical protein